MKKKKKSLHVPPVRSVPHEMKAGAVLDLDEPMPPVETLTEFPANGCPTRYIAYAVLKKEGTHGLFVMRKLVIEQGRIVAQEDDVEDLHGIKMGKVETELVIEVQ